LAVIANPPFNKAMDFLLRAHEECPSGYIAFLLRAGFFEAKTRAAWLAENQPSDVLICSPRPFGTPWGICWFIWNGASLGYDVIERHKY
jgi:hypothetical protein